MNRDRLLQTLNAERYILANHIPGIRPDNVEPRSRNLLENLFVYKCSSKPYRSHLFNSNLLPALNLLPNLHRFTVALFQPEIERSRQNRFSSGRSVHPDHRNPASLENL